MYQTPVPSLPHPSYIFRQQCIQFTLVCIRLLYPLSHTLHTPLDTAMYSVHTGMHQTPVPSLPHPSYIFRHNSVFSSHWYASDSCTLSPTPFRHLQTQQCIQFKLLCIRLLYPLSHTLHTPLDTTMYSVHTGVHQTPVPSLPHPSYTFRHSNVFTSNCCASDCCTLTPTASLA